MGQCDLGGIMNDKVKSYLQIIYGYRWLCIIAGIIILLACIWLYANKSSNIDDSGIRNAQEQLRNAREYNRQSIEYNHRARDAVDSGEAINKRIEQSINRSVEANQRTTDAINTSQNLAGKARADAQRAKALIRESRNIFERAEERNSQSKNETAE